MYGRMTAAQPALANYLRYRYLYGGAAIVAYALITGVVNIAANTQPAAAPAHHLFALTLCLGVLQRHCRHYRFSGDRPIRSASAHQLEHLAHKHRQTLFGDDSFFRIQGGRHDLSAQGRVCRDGGSL